MRSFKYGLQANKPSLSADVFDEQGRKIGKHKIILYDDDKGKLLDGRTVVLKGDRWVLGSWWNES
ncbi:MAG: hypothetical protein DRJ60_03410 [Thermoprotei archaeon]|nr:MAG: hypothetical protein DRJ60_03410 [Thermoprotei archaeon]